MPTTKNTRQFIGFRADVSLLLLDNSEPFSFDSVAEGGHSRVIW
jgi:hypothetical protein